MGKENPFVRAYLDSRQMELPSRPIPLDGISRLQQLDRAGIPLNYATAAGLFEEFRATGNIGGMRHLHEYGVGGYELLGKVTTHLFNHELMTAIRQGLDIDPLPILQRLVTNSLLERVGADQFQRGEFCRDVVGQGEITDWYRHFQETAYQHYGPDAVLASPLEGLRGLASDGLLGLQNEEALEEWLLIKCGLDEHTVEDFRNSRASWHLSLQGPPPIGEEDGAMALGPVEIERRIKQVLQLGEVEGAIRYLVHLPPRDQVHQCAGIFNALLQAGKQEEATGLLAGIRGRLQEANLAPEELANSCSFLFRYHFIAADAAGLAETLKGIDREGYGRLCTDLEIEDGRLPDLMLFCHSVGANPYFTDLTHVEIKSLLKGRYRDDPFPDYGGSVRAEAATMYASLLAARIFFLGEDGIKFPSPEQYRRTYHITRHLAIWYGLTGKEDEFTEWLERLFRVNSDGRDYVRDVYGELEERRSDNTPEAI